MSDAVRKLRANKVIASQPCAACGGVINFGADAAVCNACQLGHHAACWDRKGGCAGEGCLNAPLQQLEPPPAPAAAPAAVGRGMQECPHCRHVYAASRGVCPKCRRAPTPSGEYTGPKKTCVEARDALIWGIASLVCCAPLTGTLAIVRAKSAENKIERDPSLGGAGMATAGRILGIIGLVLFAIYVIVGVLGRAGR